MKDLTYPCYLKHTSTELVIHATADSKGTVVKTGYNPTRSEGDYRDDWTFTSDDYQGWEVIDKPKPTVYKTLVKGI